MIDANRLSATAPGPDGLPRHRWTFVDPAETTLAAYRDVIAAAITQARRWREQYERARQGPPSLSATTQPGAATAA